MTRTSQKEREIIFASRTAQLLDENWNIKTSPDEKYWPDLLIKTSDDFYFGLEVREVFPDENRKGSRQKKDESFRIGLIRKICKSYYSKCDINLLIKVLGEMKNIEDLADFIVRQAPTTEIFKSKRFEVNSNTVIYITRLEQDNFPYTRWLYVTDRVGLTGKIKCESLQNWINEKSKKHSKYKNNIDDVRLLLVLNKTYKSGMYELPDITNINKNKFKLIYLLSYPDRVDLISS